MLQTYLNMARHTENSGVNKIIERLATERVIGTTARIVAHMLANINTTEDFKFTLRKAFPNNLTQILVSLSGLLDMPNVIEEKTEFSEDNIFNKVQSELIHLYNIVTNLLYQQYRKIMLMPFLNTLTDADKSRVKLIFDIKQQCRPNSKIGESFLSDLKHKITALKFNINNDKLSQHFQEIDIILDKHSKIIQYNHNLVNLDKTLLMGAHSLESIAYCFDEILTNLDTSDTKNDKSVKEIHSIKQQLLQQAGKFGAIVELEVLLQKEHIEQMQKYKGMLTKLKDISTHKSETEQPVLMAKAQIFQYLDTLEQRSYIGKAQKSYILYEKENEICIQENSKIKINNCKPNIHTAAKSGHREQIQSASPKQFLEEDKHGYTPLYYALFNKHKYVFNIMLNAITEKELQDYFSKTSSTFVDITKNYNNCLEAWQKTETAELKQCLKMMDALEQIIIDKTVSSTKESKNVEIFFATAIINDFLDETLLDKFLKSFDINNPLDDNGNTALHLASLMGNCPQVKIIKSAQADISKKNKDGRTALHLASISGKEDVVKMLLSFGDTKILETDKYSNTPISLAATHGHINIVQILREKQKTYLYTALLCAVINDQVKVVEFLLRHVEEANSSVMINLSAEFGSAKVFRHLYTKQEEIDSAKILCDAVKGGSLEIIQLLLADDRGVNVDARKNKYKGDTPLHTAVREKSTDDILQYLIDHSADVNNLNELQQTPLCLAVKNVNIAAFNKLMPLSNIEITDKSKRTPLHWAAVKGSVPMTKELIKVMNEIELTIDPVDEDGNTPLHLAILHGNEHIVKELIESRADAFKLCGSKNNSNVLHLAASFGNFKLFNYLVQKFPEVNSQNDDKMTPLHVALQCRREDIALALINIHNCKVSERDKDNLKPLHYAVAQDYTDVINAILEKDKCLEDEICVAAYFGNKRVVEILLDKGADINVVYSREPFIIRTNSAISVIGHSILRERNEWRVILDRVVPMDTKASPIFYALKDSESNTDKVETKNFLRTKLHKE